MGQRDASGDRAHLPSLLCYWGSEGPQQSWIREISELPALRRTGISETLINIFQDTLAVEYKDYPLSKYSVEWQPDDRHLLRVGNPRLYQHPYQTPQLPLWEVGEVEWHVIIRCEQKSHRKRKVVRSFTIQLPLPIDSMGANQ